MSSKQIVLDTLEFRKTNRVPRQLWLLPWAVSHYPESVDAIKSQFPNDINSCPLFLKQPLQTRGSLHGRGVYVDEWGCIFKNYQDGIIGQVKTPLVEDWTQIDKVRTPIERLSVDIEQVNAFCANTETFVVSGICPRPFEQLQFIRGTENLYIDLAIDDSDFKAMLKTLHNFYLSEMELWAKTNVDALFIMDDWGAQKALLISPDKWRKYFKPLYRDYSAIAHQNGKKVFMHSDGYIFDILADLIEIGVDAINSQIFCMGVEELGRRFRGQITFWGEIDRQHILPNAKTDEVAQAVKKVKHNLYDNGGCIAQCEFGLGAKPENVYTVFETWNTVL